MYKKQEKIAERIDEIVNDEEDDFFTSIEDLPGVFKIFLQFTIVAFSVIVLYILGGDLG